MENEYKKALQRLNKEQKEAVTTIEGPVMVVAGPGTGKTQVLALRIAYILENTDTSADSILCLTFTRAGVRAMQERLEKYIHADARKVVVQTFHGYAHSLVEKYYEVLDFETPPRLVKDDDAVLIIDELLHAHNWQYIYSRSSPALYFNDLKTLVSLLKREGLSSSDLMIAIDSDIKRLETDPESISSRGESKGKLKKEIQKKIDALARTREVATFFERYEAFKKERGLMDYDDVLEYAVKIVEESESARADVQETYLYVLVDEHQDSSGIQNRFLEAVWKGTEKPNIFVVGDDRQLIYGFGGAKLSYFEEFKSAFGQAHQITLIENYRSTAPILSLADELLQSSLASDTLKSNRTETHPVVLSQYVYPRDEIIGAGLHFKKVIAEGVLPEECALLVPKNRHIRSAVQTLRDMGLPVRSSIGTSFFEVPETESLRIVLGVIASPYDNILLAKTLLDTVSGIPVLRAHAFLHENNNNTLSLETLISYGKGGSLFDESDPIASWGNKIASWITYHQTHSLLETVHKVGNELLVVTADGHEALVRRVEVVRTFIHLVTERLERNRKETLTGFLQYLNRLEEYNHTLTTASFGNGKGISVMTLHASKGLEYESVWIAHMNESVLMASKRMAFTLPESLEGSIEKKNKEVAKRELYVAITRAKRLCTISYATTSHTGGALDLVEIVADISKEHFIVKDHTQTEAELLAHDPRIYIEKQEEQKTDVIVELVKSVSDIYTDTKVSVTLLNNFYECPWKWYFKNLLQLPEAKSERLKFGSAVHSTIEKILLEKKKPTTTFIKNTMVACLTREGVKDKNAQTRLTHEGVEAVENWVATYYTHLAKDYTSERPLSHKDTRFPEFTLYGKIDLTERFPDGTMTVTDFKTGSSKTSGVIEKRDEEGRLSSFMRQLAMYSYLIYGVEKGKVVNESRLLFLEADKGDKNALYSTTVSQEEIDLLIRDISDYRMYINEGEWYKRPCKVVAYGAGNNECEHCALARRIYGTPRS
jgi:DNA helicase-2/ATP-dependent DNA helicase PcrA